MALPRPWRCFLGALLCWLVSAAFFSAAAFAAEYEPPSDPAEPGLEEPAECPGEVEPYEGEDAAALELRLLRGELREFCVALSDRLGLIRQRAWWSVAELSAVKGQGAATVAAVDELSDLLDGEPPLAVTGDVVDEASPEVIEAIDASGAATKEALWFGIGVLVALLAAYGLYRQVMPRG